MIVQPDTVVHWHRTAWRRYWRWKSRGGKRGRPRIEAELAALIRRMTRENPRWRHMRVLGELQKLGYRVSLQTVRRYRQDVPRDPASSWRTFLENHRPQIWAADFFTVHTLGFQTLYVFFLHRARSADRGAPARHRASDGGVGVASADQRDALGPRAAVPDP